MKSEKEFCQCNHFLCLQGDFGQSHKYCPSNDHPLDFYSYGRTVLVNFKSDTFMAGNGLNFTFEIASKFYFDLSLYCHEPLCRENRNYNVFIQLKPRGTGINNDNLRNPKSKSVILWIRRLMTYFFFIPGCNRTYEQEFGYLKSPGWPDIYPHSIDCTTILKAPQNHSISLFFDTFNLESHSSCQFDYLEVKSLCTQRPVWLLLKSWRIPTPLTGGGDWWTDHHSALCLPFVRFVMAARPTRLSSTACVVASCPTPSSRLPTSSTCTSRATSPTLEMVSRPRGRRPLKVQSHYSLEDDNDDNLFG